MSSDDATGAPAPPSDDGPSRRAIFNLVGLAVVLASFAAFIVQNTQSTSVQWLTFDGDAALWLLMLASAVAGSVVTLMFGVLLRRRRRTE
ncbi:MAG: hypothetical protein AAGA99_21695 [Actinomycetota bacterium]